MTDAEILAELGTDSLLNRVRRTIAVFSAQDRAVPPMRLRRAEFAAAREVIAMVKEDRS